MARWPPDKWRQFAPRVAKFGSEGWGGSSAVPDPEHPLDSNVTFPNGSSLVFKGGGRIAVVGATVAIAAPAVEVSVEVVGGC